jgi:hypothetical protein
VNAFGFEVMARGFKVNELRFAEWAPVGGAIEEDEQPVGAAERFQRLRISILISKGESGDA